MDSNTYGTCYSKRYGESMPSQWLSQTQTQTQTHCQLFVETSHQSSSYVPLKAVNE